MNKRRIRPASLLASPHIVWCVLFMIAPLFFVAYYAFTDKTGAFTFDNFFEIFTSPAYSETLLVSVYYAFLATIVCLLVAYPLAYFLSQMKARHQSVMIMLVMLPMWTNFIVRTYSLSQLLENNGIINQFLGLFGVEPIQFLGTGGAVVLGMVYNYLPYMVLPIYTVMVKLDRRLLEAARDLGANPINTLCRVIFPLTFSGIVSGVTMVFVPSISTFYISKAMSNRMISLVGDTIESQFLGISLNYNMGSALSYVLMILILVSMLFMNKFGDENERGIVV